MGKMKGDADDIPSCSTSTLERARKMKSKNQNEINDFYVDGIYYSRKTKIEFELGDFLIIKNKGYRYNPYDCVHSSAFMPSSFELIQKESSDKQGKRHYKIIREVEYDRITRKSALSELINYCKHLVPKPQNHKPRNAISPDFIGDNPDTMKEGTICPLETPSRENHKPKVFIERAGKLDKEGMRAVLGTDKEYSDYVDKITKTPSGENHSQQSATETQEVNDRNKFADALRGSDTTQKEIEKEIKELYKEITIGFNRIERLLIKIKNRNLE